MGWQCRTYLIEGKNACDMKALGEQILQDAFVRVFNRMYENKDSFIRTLKANIQLILSKRDDSEPLHEVVQNIEQLKNGS